MVSKELTPRKSNFVDLRRNCPAAGRQPHDAHPETRDFIAGRHGSERVFLPATGAAAEF